MLNRNSGFTLVELITVILLLGILAVSVGPRIFGGSAVSESVISPQLINLLRNQQTYAMQDAINPGYGVSFATQSIIPYHRGEQLGSEHSLSLPNDMGFSVSSPLENVESGFRFNALGCPVSLRHESDKQSCAQSANVQIALVGSQTQYVCVQHQGYIRNGRC